MNPSRVYIEISQTVLRALRDDRGMELPLERDARGRLTATSKERVADELSRFVDRKSWHPRVKAFCGIGASGVSLRRLSLPASGKEEFQRVLLLQIESEFPLPPEQLAWGWRQSESDGSAGKRDVLVAAVKKEVIEEYAALLALCGMNPVFTLAALARNHLCPQPIGSHSVLEVARGHSELMTFENGEPVALRVLSVGGDSIERAMGSDRNGRKIFIFSGPDYFAKWSAEGFESLQFEAGPGRSSATLGLRKSVEQNGGAPPLVLQIKAKTPVGKIDFSQPEVKLWLKRAAVLLVMLLILPFSEAIVGKLILSKRIAALKAQRDKVFPVIDRELDFLQTLKASQPPFLDALYVLAKSAPPNAKIESVTMNRRGEISLKGSMQNGQVVTDFRSKAIGSGFFSSVAVEEQAPTQDRQKVNVRMTMQWKPAADRALAAVAPTAEEIERARTNTMAQAGGGGFPSGMMSPGMPVMMPEGMPSPRPRR